MKLSQIILLLSAATFLAAAGCAPCRHYNRLQVAAFYGPGRPIKKPYGTVIRSVQDRRGWPEDRRREAALPGNRIYEL